MPKIAFMGVDGNERLHELSPRHVLRIGREPGNDVVLRDPKVSRNHAEVRFEKGFFVLHDLSSANGCYVNGKKVRVAPLVNGAHIRMGNSIATFSAEPSRGEPGLPTSTSPFEISAPPRTSPSMPKPAPEPKTELGREREPEMEPELGETAPHPRADGGKPPPDPDDDIDTEDLGDLLGPERKELHGSRFYIAVDAPAGESGSISADSDKPLLYFHAPGRLIAFVAAVVSAIVTIGGVGATLILVAGSRFPAALAASFLTAAFATVILLLVPPRHLFLFRDQEMKDVAMTIRQESRFAFPLLRFSAAQPDGHTVGFLQKNSFTNLGRKHWWVLDRQRLRPVACAVEHSWPYVIARKFLGAFSTSFRTDFRIYHGRSPAGWLFRRDPKQHALDLSEDASLQLDRRMGIALAVVITAVER